MPDFPLLNKLLISCISLFGIFLAFLVYFSNRKLRTNQLYFLMSIFVLFWIGFYYFFDLTNQPYNALTWIRLASASVAGFLISFYFFFTYFLELEKKFRILNKFILGIGILLVTVFGFTDFFIPGVRIEPWGNDLILKNSVILFYSFVAILSGFILFLLWKNYFNIPKEKKLRVQYFILGSAIWVTFNLTFNVFFPLIRHSIRYHQFGDYSVFFLLSFTAYAIVKQQLFGIRVVLTTIFVGMIAVLLFVDTVFLSQGLIIQLVKGLILVIFLFFGYSLIRSVLREIKLREELEKAYAELKRLDTAKSEFISITSHQLRTPLTAIKGYVSMILDGSYGPISEKVKEKMQNVFQSTERLIKLINDVLNFSRIETGKIEIRLSEVALGDVIKEIFNTLRIQAENKNIYLRWEEPKKPLPKILADEEKLQHAILNVVDNGIKYTEKGGIIIRAEGREDSVIIEVSDTGAGMTKEELSKIFKSFSRGEAGAQLYTEGTGLGLFIARKFIELQGGKIWAESKGKGLGSVFYIKLPISADLNFKEFLQKV